MDEALEKRLPKPEELKRDDAGEPRGRLRR